MEPTEFSLRPATSDDLAKIVEIENRVHVAPWTHSHFESELQKPYSHFLVLSDDETDEVIAGYAVFWQMGSEPQEQGERHGGDAEVLNIVVDLPFRGRGFAKQMLRQVVTSAVRDGCQKVILDVRKTNVSAIQLYQSLGFSITQVRKKFYSNGEDAYGMTLFLDDPGTVSEIFD
jgi:ribosomal-protein-alanine N-acetyltransferase